MNMPLIEFCPNSSDPACHPELKLLWLVMVGPWDQSPMVAPYPPNQTQTFQHYWQL